MTEYEKKLQELKPLMGLTDTESMAKKEVLLQWIEANSESDESQKSLNSFIEDGIGETESYIKGLRKQIGQSYELLPIAYIARHYFGKSRAWLYQRINGNKVHGKTYSLNEEQKEIFNNAIQDIARQIGSVRLA